MKQRLLAIILALFLVIETVPAYALTTETSVPPKEIECICDEACTEATMNFDCPICGMEGASPEVCGCAVFEPGEDKGDTLDDNAPVCICTQLCTEDAMNSDCPICGIEGASPEVCSCAVFEPGEDKGDTLDDNAPVCICTQACAEDTMNLECPICGVDGATLDDCGYMSPITNNNEPSVDGDLVCICSLPCAEGEMNSDCPVCGVDGVLPDACSCYKIPSDELSTMGKDMSLYRTERASGGANYDFAAPKVVDLRMNYTDGYTGEKKEVSLYDNTIKDIIIASEETPVYQAVFENGARVEKVYITSTRDGTKLYLEAFRDEENEDLFITNDVFNGDSSYVPKTVNVEFTKKTDDIVVTDSIDWDTVKTNILPSDQVTITESTDTAVTAILNFQDFVNQPVVNAFIDLIDDANDTNIGDWLGESEKWSSYFIKGVDDEQYIAYLDRSDPKTYAMIVSDVTGSEAVKLVLKSDESLEDLSGSLNDINTAAKLLCNTLTIEKEMTELRDEVELSNMSTEEKLTAHERIDALEKDKKVFSLLTTIIPAIVAAPAALGASMSAAPALLFSGILAVITSSSDYFWDQRIAVIEGEETSPNFEGFTCVDSGYCGIDGKNLIWRLSDTGLMVISGTGEMNMSYYLNVHKNTREKIKNIIIEPGATTIDGRAFLDCTNLESISIPDTVETIGGSAFKNCSSLTSLTIPDSVTTIDMNAFSSCTALTDLKILGETANIGAWAFSNCTKLSSARIGSSWIGNDAFNGCTNLRNVIITSDTDIHMFAFNKCSSLSSVVFGDGVTTISDYAFYARENLESVIIPDSVTSIGVQAFYACQKLKVLTLPARCTTIGESAFANCYFITDISIPYGLDKIEAGLFAGCYGLTNVTIPDTVTSIGFGAFDSCTSLIDLTIPNSVISIDKYAFHDCTNLSNIWIPTSVISIGECAFENCNSLTDVYYGGTEEEFKRNLSVNDFPPDATIHYNSTPPESNASIKVTSPVFDTVTYGYFTQPTAKAITITNTGNSDATISSVTVNGNNFTIGGSGSNVAAGASIDTWTIWPNMALNAGVHTATITVVYDNNKRATASVTFTVNKAVPAIGSGVETLWAIENSQPLLEDVAISRNAASATGVSSEALTGSWTWKTPKTALVATDSNPTQSFTAVFTPDSENYAAVEAQLPVKITRVEATIDGGFDMKVLSTIGEETLIEAAITVIGAPLTDNAGNYSLDKIVTWNNLCENIAAITTANAGTVYKATVKGIKPGITMVGIAVQEKNMAYVLVQVQGDSTGNNASEVIAITEMLDEVMDANNLTPTDKMAVSALVETVINLSDAEKDKLTAEAIKTLDILAEKAKDLTIKVDTTPKDNNATKPQLVNIAGAAAASGAQAAEVVVEVKAVTPTAGGKMELELSLKVDGQEQPLLSPLFFEITLPDSIDPERLTIKHIKNNGDESNVIFTFDGQTVKFKLLSFSSLRFLSITRPSGGNNGSDDSSSYRDGEWEFWQDVSSKIEKASPGDIVKVNARGYDQMSWSVMEALRQKTGVTLIITWNGGEDIVIPSSAALYDPLRIYWPLSYLAGYNFGTGTVTNLNPETGGVWIVDAPVVAESPATSAVTDPRRGLADTPELAAKGIERTIPSITEPETIPSAESSSPAAKNLVVPLMLVITLAAICYGIWAWKSRKDTEGIEQK